MDSDVPTLQEAPSNTLEREGLEAAMRLIAGSLRSRPRREVLALVAGIDPSVFYARFTAHFGETPLRALFRHRIEEAKRLMTAGEKLVDVARKTGFCQHSHFGSRFRQATGTTPAEWLARGSVPIARVAAEVQARPVTSAERQKLSLAMELIARSPASRPRLSVLARTAGMSRWHFDRRFKACFGETPRQAILRLLMEESKHLMSSGQTPAEAARRCGFCRRENFSRRFKLVTGMTPTDWLRERSFL